MVTRTRKRGTMPTDSSPSLTHSGYRLSILAKATVDQRVLRMGMLNPPSADDSYLNLRPLSDSKSFPAA